VPSVSKKQHNLLEAVAHNPAFAKKVGIKQSVGKDFAAADKGKNFKGGGMAEPKKMMKKEVSFMKKKGAPKSMIKHEEAEMSGMGSGMGMGMGMKNGGMKKMASGGMTSMGKVKTAAPSRDGVAVKGKTKGKMVTMAGNKKMSKGGYC
jgi:hypothetical protein